MSEKKNTDYSAIIPGTIRHFGSRRRILAACIDCGQTRWIGIRHGQPESLRCKSCAHTGKNHYAYKDRVKSTQGYIFVKLSTDSFFSPMIQPHKGILEHRLIMAEHLGRCLQPWEQVHHKNGIKDDNRLENLELTINGNHILQHNKGYRDGYRQGFLDGQSRQIQELKEQLRLLQWQLKEVRV